MSGINSFALAYEQGNFTQISQLKESLNVSTAQIPKAYKEATQWADQAEVPDAIWQNWAEIVPGLTILRVWAPPSPTRSRRRPWRCGSRISPGATPA